MALSRDTRWATVSCLVASGESTSPRPVRGSRSERIAQHAGLGEQASLLEGQLEVMAVRGACRPPVLGRHIHGHRGTRIHVLEDLWDEGRLTTFVCTQHFEEPGEGTGDITAIVPPQ
jgi:hypothetical protein